MDADSDTDLEPDFGMMDNATVDSRVRQDDYQQPTGSGHIGGDTMHYFFSSNLTPVPSSSVCVCFVLWFCLEMLKNTTIVNEPLLRVLTPRHAGLGRICLL